MARLSMHARARFASGLLVGVLLYRLGEAAVSQVQEPPASGAQADTPGTGDDWPGG